MKTTGLDRFLLLLTGTLAAYQIAVGVDGLGFFPMTAYTLSFGVLLVAGLLLIILGLEVLESPVVVIVSTIIPLSLSLGLVWDYLASFRIPYLLFTIIGFVAIILSRSLSAPKRLATIVLAIVHGVAGMTIFLLPVILAATGKAQAGFALVGVGGALIGLGGILLSFLKMGKPVISREAIFKILPGLLLLMTTAFVAGFTFA